MEIKGYKMKGCGLSVLLLYYVEVHVYTCKLHQILVFNSAALVVRNTTRGIRGLNYYNQGRNLDITCFFFQTHISYYNMSSSSLQ